MDRRRLCAVGLTSSLKQGEAPFELGACTSSGHFCVRECGECRAHVLYFGSMDSQHPLWDSHIKIHKTRAAREAPPPEWNLQLGFHCSLLPSRIFLYPNFSIKRRYTTTRCSGPSSHARTLHGTIVVIHETFERGEVSVVLTNPRPGFSYKVVSTNPRPPVDRREF